MKILLLVALVVGGVLLCVAMFALVEMVASIFVGATDDTQDRIRVAYFPNIGHAIPIVGLEQGIFDDHMPHITIEKKLFDGGPQVIESFFADSIDIAYMGPGPAINGFLNSENDNRLKILSGAASGGASFIVHPNSLQDDFDFAGKKIAAPQIGNTQDVSLRHYLSEHNLTTIERGGNVTVYNVSPPDIYTLFVKGDIDGAWVAEPWATIFETELGGTRLFYEESLWSDGQFASVLLVANVDYISKNPETVRLWLKAHNTTADWINANKKDAGDVFNHFLTGVFGRGLDERVVDTSLSNIEITTDPIVTSIHLFAQRADSLGYLGRNSYSLSEIFYNMDSSSSSDDGG